MHLNADVKIHLKNCYHNEILFKQLDLTLQEILLLKSLEEFYNKQEYFDLLSSIINGTSDISRRTFEYFVTNYAMKHNISYELNEKDVIGTFIVHSSYKDQLKAHRKRYFDPFGRGDRIPFLSKNGVVITTIGQLNFYRWFFAKNIYNYCIENYNKIQNELLKNRTVKKKKHFIEKKKYTSIIRKQPNYIKIDYNSYNTGDIIVSFDI